MVLLEDFSETSTKCFLPASPSSQYLSVLCYFLTDLLWSSRHWQLRDLICVNTASSNELIYPCDRVVRSIDLKTGNNKPITEFSFDPRCIQTLGSNVAVGGLNDARPSRGHSSKGLFAVHNREQNETATQELGELINNSISFYSEPGTSETSQLKAIVCNNDNRLYFTDIETSRIAITGRIKFPAPLNHASISPNRKTIVACGDTPQIYLCPKDGDRPYVANAGTGSTSSGRLPRGNWQTTETIETWSEYGFSTGFHSSGVVFGVAFQPGVAHLFDIRNLSEPLTQIYSTRPKEWPGAFRCLKFSQGPEDLLFLSEQMGRVHVVDLRNFSNHQILMVPPQLSESAGGSGCVDEGESDGRDIIQFYDDMLKTGEAFPWEVNETEVHQMQTEQHINSSSVFDYDEFQQLNSVAEQRQYGVHRTVAADDVAVEDDEMPSAPSLISAPPPLRRTSMSTISSDNGIRDLRMDGVSLSTMRRGSGSFGNNGINPAQIMQQSPPSQASSNNQFRHQSPNSLPSFVIPSSYSAYSRGRRMSANQMYNSLRYLSGSGSGSGSGSRSGSSFGSGSGSVGGGGGLLGTRSNSTGASSMAPFGRPFDATRHHFPSHSVISSTAATAMASTTSTGGLVSAAVTARNAQTERGISGIAWTDYEGGKLVVGTDSGVGVWSVDQVARRTFPDYEKR